MKPPDRAKLASPIASLLKRAWLRWALGLGVAAILLAMVYLVYARRPLTVEVAAFEANVPVRVLVLSQLFLSSLVATS